MFGIIKAIATIVNALSSVISLASQYLKDRAEKKAKEKIDKANEAHNQSQKNPDDLKGQADALCKLEKATNPKSDCDS